MKKIYKKSRVKTMILLALLVAMSSTYAQTIVYVSTDGTGDGSSWASPTSDLQGTINNAVDAMEIWIKSGVYFVPGDTIFTLKDGVSLIGGFTGNETNKLQRVDYKPK
ncbi:MAG: hypothetical protein K9G38_07815, partial [Bacteroidales bacterium]|nr:hypothetical protein [Bacteroidales bacterium]